MRPLRALGAVAAGVAVAASWSSLLTAQPDERRIRDSSLTLSVTMRGWPTAAGPIQGPTVGLHLRTEWLWLRMHIDASAANIDRAGKGYATPYLLDGQLALSTQPMRLGKAGADISIGLARDAFDPRAAWIQQSGSLRTWYGVASHGVWARADAHAPLDAHATPTSAELQLGGWIARGTTEVSASVRHIQTGRLKAVGPDSTTTDLSACRLDYDRSRVLQQYRTLCPQRLRTLDVGVGAAWSVHTTRIRLFAAHRVLGQAAFGAPRESWAGGNIEFGWSDEMRFTLEADRRPTDIVRGLPAHRRFAVGLRLSAGLLQRRYAVDEARTDSLPARRVGVLRLGVAANAEVRGDFTDWQPVPLKSDGAGVWILPSGIRHGVYMLSVRLDGGVWHAPPGLPTMADGFGGMVGVLLVD